MSIRSTEVHRGKRLGLNADYVSYCERALGALRHTFLAMGINHVWWLLFDVAQAHYFRGLSVSSAGWCAHTTMIALSILAAWSTTRITAVRAFPCVQVRDLLLSLVVSLGVAYVLLSAGLWVIFAAVVDRGTLPDGGFGVFDAIVESDMCIFVIGCSLSVFFLASYAWHLILLKGEGSAVDE